MDKHLVWEKKHIQNSSGKFPQNGNFDDEQGEERTRTG
jgi:hypothetical protein